MGASRLRRAPSRYSFLLFSFCFPRLPPLIAMLISRGAFDIKNQICGPAVLARPRTEAPLLPNYFNAHRARRTADALDGGLNRSGVQIRHFLLGDLLDLLQSDL